VVGLSGHCFSGGGVPGVPGSFAFARECRRLALVTLSWSCSVCSSCEGRRSLRSPERATSVPSDPGWREPPSSAGLRECAARIAAGLVGRVQPASANAMSAGWSGGLPRRFGRVTIERQRRPTRQGRDSGAPAARLHDPVPRHSAVEVRGPGDAFGGRNLNPRGAARILRTDRPGVGDCPGLLDSGLLRSDNPRSDCDHRGGISGSGARMRPSPQSILAPEAPLCLVCGDHTLGEGRPWLAPGVSNALVSHSR